MSLEKNPFSFGQTVEKTSFFDRVEERKILHSAFISGQNTILIAPRRYGKSSLIRKVLLDVKREGLLSVYIDLFRANTLHKFNDIISQAIAKATNTPLKRFGRFLKEWAPKLSPRVIFRSDALPEVEFEFSHSPEEQKAVLHELLAIVNKFATVRKVGGVIVFDEFHEILQFGDVSLLKEMRAIIQHDQKISYCFAGSKRHLISEIFTDSESPFYQFGKIMSLSRLPRDDFFLFVKKHLKAFDMKEIDDLINGILDFTGCHPYYTQMFCSYLWDSLMQEKKPSFHDTIDIILKNQSYAYTTFWDKLSARQKNLMIALSRQPTASLHKAESILKWALGSAATVTKSTRSLERDGFIESMNGKPCIADPFFKVWIERF